MSVPLGVCFVCMACASCSVCVLCVLCMVYVCEVCVVFIVCVCCVCTVCVYRVRVVWCVWGLVLTLTVDKHCAVTQGRHRHLSSRPDLSLLTSPHCGKSSIQTLRQKT